MSDTFAIVVGNNSYFDPYQLNNAIFDANAIKDVFANPGYDVMEYYDITQKDIVDVLRVIRENTRWIN